MADGNGFHSVPSYPQNMNSLVRITSGRIPKRLFFSNFTALPAQACNLSRNSGFVRPERPSGEKEQKWFSGAGKALALLAATGLGVAVCEAPGKEEYVTTPSGLKYLDVNFKLISRSAQSTVLFFSSPVASVRRHKVAIS